MNTIQKFPETYKDSKELVSDAKIRPRMENPEGKLPKSEGEIISGLGYPPIGEWEVKKRLVMDWHEMTQTFSQERPVDVKLLGTLTAMSARLLLVNDAYVGRVARCIGGKVLAPGMNTRATEEDFNSRPGFPDFPRL